MNLKDLSLIIAKEHGLPQRTAKEVVQTITNTVVKQVAKGDKVTLGGFGVFKKVSRKARHGRNPFNGESLEIPAKVVPKFVASKAFKSKLSTKTKKRAKKAA